MPHRSDSPLYNALKSYAELDPARFHMPGHKGELYEFDVTELPGTDNLAHPIGAIKALEEACARAFCCRDALVSVGGSTACNIAMLLALGSGKKVLLGRSCHKSVISGMALAGHEAYSVFPDGDGVFTPESISLALDKAPCDAVFITSPTYRGYVLDIAGIAKAAHSRGALLLVDCAHGAHFAFGEGLPPVPREADMWCVSCHKTLNALTQTAVLCLGESLPCSKEQSRFALSLVQSSSPSYPLMLSVEHAINNAGGWDEQVSRMLALREALLNINGLTLFDSKSAFDFDATRLNIGMRGISGYALGALLEKANIYPEMCDGECVTLITSPADRSEWYMRLYDALTAISKKQTGACACEPSVAGMCQAMQCAGFSENGCDVRGAVLGKKLSIPIKNSIGRTAAAPVGMYPPGIAVLFPGEVITDKAVALLLNEQRAGAELFGLDEGRITVLCEGGECNG